jgi:hypothetical protein
METPLIQEVAIDFKLYHKTYTGSITRSSGEAPFQRNVPLDDTYGFPPT